MKRLAFFKEYKSSSSDDSSESDSEDDKLDRKMSSKQIGGSRSFLDTMTAANKKKKLGSIDYEVLSKHGYHGGPSVLKLPPPKAEEKGQDWLWSTGKGAEKKNSTEEPFAVREQTRYAAHGENVLQLEASLQLDKREKKASSISQKEKRKRDIGQASRGKNYVEEQKRLLRDSGIYSGFDS